MAPHLIERTRTTVAGQLRNAAPGRRLRLQLAHEVLERHLGAREDVRILDAGSEEGLLCLGLARRHPTWMLVAADISPGPLRTGRGWAQQAGASVHFVRCDLQRPLGEAAYDAVVSLECLAEIPDDHAAMTSLARALRSGGLFVAHVPTHDWTPVLRGAERTWRREARHGYDPEELAATLDGLGLQVLEVRPTFRRTVALAQDVRDRFKGHGRPTRLGLLPLLAGAVALERSGVTWGPARGLFVVALKR